MSALVNEIACDDQLIAESVRRRVGELKSSLLSEDPSRLEELSVDEVAICWLRLQFTEYRCTKLDENSREWAEFWVKQRDRAQRAHESAVRHLLTVQQAENRLRRKGSAQGKVVASNA
ncbi:MAG: hypothetical protein DWQ34_24200 [Planctomycetota bacterium]|nr:MAG: hypothetical protein DWQ29_12875 [Planctomycetota bacterium]REJ87751.1 MAG: hypothetical protein DWQ34_24200 [Planctomycetota bacterium]REK27834.1 MAG: hypothetical protein DWQ41_06950 [Planctomycetota bacterium]REK40288.1 MAG: hypothetical protein DWQ45_00190 [Planctomycetota bacterium]